MTATKSAGIPTLAPVIYVHARGCEPATEKQIQALSGLGLPLCSRLAKDGLEQTTHGYDQPGELLAELSSKFPGRPVAFLRSGLQPSVQQIDQLTIMLERADQPLALTLLSNAAPLTNPLAGLVGPESISPGDLAGLINLLSPGNIHRLDTWTDHFVILSAKLVVLLATNGSRSSLMQQVLTAGGSLELSDQLFLHDPDQPIFAAAKLHQ